MNFTELYNILNQNISSNKDLKSIWFDTIEPLTKQFPNVTWENLLNYDFSLEVNEVNKWLDQFFEELPESEKIVYLSIAQYWSDEQKRAFYSLSVKTYSNFIPEDENWPGEPSFLPQNPYCVPDSINIILDQFYNSKLEDVSLIDYIIPLCYVSMILKNYKSKLTNKALILIAGYEEGDFLLI